MSLNYFNYPTEDGDYSAPVALDTPPWEEPPAPTVPVSALPEIRVAGPTPDGATVVAEKINEPKKRGRPKKGRDVTLQKKVAPEATPEVVKEGENKLERVVNPPVAATFSVAEPAPDHALSVGRTWNLAGSAYRVVAFNDGLVVLERIK